MKKVIKNAIIGGGLAIIITGMFIGGYKHRQKNNYISQVQEVYKNYNDIMKDITPNMDKINIEDFEYLRNSQEFMESPYYYAIEAELFARRGNGEKSLENVNNGIEIIKKYPNNESLLVEVYRQGINISSGFNENGAMIEYTYRLLEIINNPKTIWANDVQKQQAEISVYLNKLLLLCKNNILDKAKYYYDMLDNMVISDEISDIVYRQILFAKLVYADCIDDYKSVEKFAVESHESLIKKDERTGSNVKNAGLLNLAVIDMKMGILDGVEDKLLTSVDFYKANNDLVNLGIAYSNLGEYYNLIGENNTSVKYFSESIEILSGINIYLDIDRSINYILDNREDYEDIVDINEVLNYSYNNKGKFEEQRQVSYTMSSIININDEINSEKLLMLKSQNESIELKNKIIISSACVLIIILLVLVLLVMKLFNQIAIRQDKEKQLKTIISRDYLTGAMTKEIGLEKINKVRALGDVFSIAIIDIDDFKKVNDVHGHLFGDRVLAKVAKELMRDISGENFLVRFGGEEFIYIINSHLENAKNILETKRQAVENIRFNNNAKVTISIGVTESNGETVHHIIEKADKLLYIAKGTGKNKIVAEESSIG